MIGPPLTFCRKKVDVAHLADGDGAGEADDDRRVEIEPVELVDERDLVARGLLRDAVGRWGEVHPPPGELGGVGDGEVVIGEDLERPGHRGRRCDRHAGGEPTRDNDDGDDRDEPAGQVAHQHLKRRRLGPISENSRSK